MGNQQIDILMLGGKRCGKTTVLASMIRNMDKVLAGTGMSLQAVGTDTQAQLDSAVRSIRNKLEDFNTPLTRVKVDENPTSAESEYYFLLTVSGQKQIGICIHDIPGEWLTDSALHAARVKELVRDSKVIMIAIDTPYLFAKMTDEGYGVYHREYNKPLEIANFIKESFSEEDIRERMILFVPLKCERYFHLTHSRELNIFNRNYMEEIVDAVGNGYHDLLVYLRTSRALINNCTIAVTPILSAGGIDFVRFEQDEETGKMVSLYQKPEFLADWEQGYTPRFCEQPMVYALSYLMTIEYEQLMRSQVDQGLSGASAQYAYGLSADQLRTIKDTLRKKMMRNTGVHPADGFFFIQNPKDL